MEEKVGSSKETKGKMRKGGEELWQAIEPPHW